MKTHSLIAISALVILGACDKSEPAGDEPASAEPAAAKNDSKKAEPAESEKSIDVADPKLDGSTKWMVRYAGPLSGEVSGEWVNASKSVNNYQVRGHSVKDSKKRERGKNSFSAMIFGEEGNIRGGTMMLELPDGTRCIPPKNPDDGKVENSDVELISANPPTKLHAKMSGHVQCGDERVAYKAEFLDDVD